MRRYLINIDGFEPHERCAATASKARYEDFKAARDAGYFAGPSGFREYLARAYTRHLGPVTFNAQAPE
jgi:hypothetical protein